MQRSTVRIALSIAIVLLGTRDAYPGVIAFGTGLNGGLVGFNAAAGAPPISLDFDAIVPGTDITEFALAGIMFGTSATGAPLIVVDGLSTVTPGGFSGAPAPATNKLFPTTPGNVLSPGGITLGPGPNNPVENDDLNLTFLTPLAAFGFDHLSQSADGASFTNIQVFNQLNVLLLNMTIPISNVGGVGGGAAGGADFFGIVGTESDLIGRIVINEGDNNNVFPDSNIGFDTFRFQSAATAVPEPTSLLLLGSGAAGLLARSRRRSRSRQ